MKTKRRVLTLSKLSTGGGMAEGLLSMLRRVGVAEARTRLGTGACIAKGEGAECMMGGSIRLDA